VGVFAKVMLAVAILVANGALLFFILRFLLWLAFPAMKGDEPEVVPSTRTAPPATVNILGAAAAAATTGAGAAATAPGAPGAPQVFASIAAPRPRAYPHRLLIGLPVILALFAGGVWLGSIVGGSGDASAATTKIIHVTGKVVTVNSTKTEVQVPGTSVLFKKGSVVTVPPTTVKLPSETVIHTIHRTRTQTVTGPGSTTVFTTTITIPTTITSTGTVTTTETTTETVTTTGSTGTATVT
jgi:hypothetical protein